MMLKLINVEDDLAVQLVGTIKIYNAIVESINRNIQKANNAKADEMIKLGSHISLDRLAKSVNMTDAMFRAFNTTADLHDISRDALRNATSDMDFPSLSLVVEEISASGVILFEIDAYTLTKNWFETALIGILAIAQIAVGAVMMASGPGFCGVFLLTQGC